MNSYVVYVATVLAVLAFVKNGEALQCWDCNSDAYGRCGDYFNTTQIPRVSLAYSPVTGLPSVINCDSGPAQFGQYGYSRQVCMKRVETNRRFGTTTYTRSCHTLTPGENVGTCPTRTVNSDTTVDFCQYCDTHECNGAQGLQKNAFLMGLIPIAVALVLRK